MTSGTVDGLHYELHGGPVAGREVVLLSSGLGGSGAFWAPQMQALTARWPVVTYGVNYDGTIITEQTEKEGMAQPLHYWDPSIAPSGMAFYTGDLFPEWQGDLFVGALKMRKLVRLRIQDGKVTEEEDLLTDLGERIRDVRMGPDGALWLLTDSPRGKVYRMVPLQ